MYSVRNNRPAGLPAPICLASALLLLIAAGPLSPSASAQSGADDKLQSALLGLKQEIPDTVVAVTPQLLRLQKELVETLETRLKGIRAEAEVGLRTTEEVLADELGHIRELETLRVLEARSRNPSISGKDLLKIRIEVRSEALPHLRKLRELVERRLETSEATQVDVAAARAAVLKVEIALEALTAAAQ